MAKRMESIYDQVKLLDIALTDLELKPEGMSPEAGFELSLIMGKLHTHLETLMVRTPEFCDADVDAINHELLDWLNLTI